MLYPSTLMRISLVVSLLLSAQVASASERTYDLYQKYYYIEDGVEYVDMS